MFKSIFQNTLAQFSGKIGTLALSVLATGFLTRLLGEEGYGQYSLITAVILLFGNIANWGTDTIAVREVAKNPSQKAVIYGNALLIRLSLAVLSVVLLLISASVVPGWNSIAIPLSIGAFVLVFLSLKTSMNIIFQSNLRYELASLAELASAMLLTALTYLVYINKGSLADVVLVWFVSVVLAAGISLYFGLKLAKLDFSFNPSVSQKLVRESLTTGALLLIYSIYNRLDIILLERFKGFSDVSNYGLAYKLYEQLILGAAFFMNSLFPYLSRAYSNKSLQEVKTYYQKSFDFLLIAGGFVTVFTFIFAPFIINVLAPGFTDAIGALRILSFSLIFAYFNHLTGYSLISFGKQKYSLFIAVIALAFNLIANYLFIPAYSLTASAVITVATEMLVLVLSSIAIYKSIGVLPSLTSWFTTLKALLVKRSVKF